MFIHVSNLGSTVKLHNANRNQNFVNLGVGQQKQNKTKQNILRELEQLTVQVQGFPKWLHEPFDPDNRNGYYFLSNGRMKITISSEMVRGIWKVEHTIRSEGTCQIFGTLLRLTMQSTWTNTQMDQYKTQKKIWIMKLQILIPEYGKTGKASLWHFCSEAAYNIELRQLTELIN